MNIDYTPPGYEILLPVGISFYTFQILSYTIDVFRGKQNPEHHFGKFALFVAFFPKLVAGPIERSNRLFPQFNLVQRIDYDRIVSGLRLMTWGFFVKLVIADRLADTVNLVYNNPRDYQGIPLIIATFFFAIQIYCDFSGYSYIAIGAAKILGFDLMENFRRPYFAKSFSEFWSRWHISLSTWFRDYLYIPLGGNRVKVGRWFANLMIVFLISGLWHGANWTFVVWGALHGGYLVATIITGFIFDRRTPGPDRIRKCGRIISVLQILLTFSLVLFAWIFFRANSISDAFYIAGHLFRGIQLQSGYGLNLGGAYEMAIIAVGLLTLFIVDLLIERGYTWELVSRRPVYVRWLIYYALIFSIILLGKFQVTEFIYSQF
jgi:D-alanyl-lipoteichoic acid acyltransferase DltB (MBOAT superfamily)